MRLLSVYREGKRLGMEIGKVQGIGVLAHDMPFAFGNLNETREEKRKYWLAHGEKAGLAHNGLSPLEKIIIANTIKRTIWDKAWRNSIENFSSISKAMYESASMSAVAFKSFADSLNAFNERSHNKGGI